jgi:hypothetical protein
MLLRDADVSTEYPKDVDDENITHQGLSPTLPGELTKISSALALFKGSRILAKTLEELYPASMTYQLSLKKLRALSDELDQWLQDLPSHLRLQFLNDKPSTAVVSCRSPLLVKFQVDGARNASLRLTRFLVAYLLLYPKSHPPSTRLPWVWDCRVDINLGYSRLRQAYRPDTRSSRRTKNELHLSLQQVRAVADRRLFFALAMPRTAGREQACQRQSEDVDAANHHTHPRFREHWDGIPGCRRIICRPWATKRHTSPETDADRLSSGSHARKHARTGRQA